jgi:delta 1-pyrroline-5-carboxylate dehydrogenase
MIVFDSADVEEAANWTAMGIWFNSGQDCCASSRVLIQSTIYDEFIEALKRKAEVCAIGQVSISWADGCPSLTNTATPRDYILRAPYIADPKR